MKKKMFIAGMSLVIALVLLATASFAWFTISTSPEVSGMNLALYTNRTLLLAADPGDGSCPADNEFQQYISLSDKFLNMTSLRPVSTVDGVNWFLPAYTTETGELADVSEFILDDSLEHANVKTVKNGTALTGNDLLAAQQNGYYVYTDVWMKTEEERVNVRLSIPHTYGTAESRHAGTTTEFGLDSEELSQAVYGTYALGEPELDEAGTALKTRTELPETALRVGFLVYQNTETLQPVSSGTSNLPFYVYEPNADKRASSANATEELWIPDDDGNTVAVKANYIKGESDTELSDGYYYVTQPIAKGEDGKGTLGTISADKLIVQLASSWDETEVIKTMRGLQASHNTALSSNDVENFGLFINTSGQFSTANNVIQVSATGEDTDIAGSNVILQLKKDTPVRVRIFIWIEGQDVDCWNDIASGTFRINLELAGETVEDAEAEEEKEEGIILATLNGMKNKQGNMTPGWFDISAAGFSIDRITELEFTKTAPSTGSYSARWIAGECTGEGQVYGYAQGNKVSIVLPEGADRIYLPEDSGYLFAWLTGCTSISGLELVDTSGVTNMTSLFSNDEKLEAIDVSHFDTSNVNRMSGMFYGCKALTELDLHSLNTSKATSFYWMFSGCENLTSLDLSSFDTSNVTSMIYMFRWCYNLKSIDLSTFDTSKVDGMDSMFLACHALEDIDLTGFDTTSLENAQNMFQGCSSLKELDLSSFDTSALEIARDMFTSCSSLETIYVGSGWTMQNVSAYTVDMFGSNDKLVGGNGTAFSDDHTDKSYARIDTADAPGYFTEKTASTLVCTLKGYGTDGNSADGWFDSTAAGIDRGTVTAVKFTRIVPSGYTATWNAGTESGSGAINAYLNGTTVSIVVPAGADKIYLPQNSNKLLYNMDSLTAVTGMRYVDTSNVTNMSSMFSGCSALTSLDVSGFNTANVTDMAWMFYGCSKVTALDVSGFNTTNVTRTRCMFYECNALTALDVSGFDTANVTDMGWMFYGCSAVTALDVSGFNTAKVVNMKSMFNQCGRLTTLDVSRFNTANVTDMGWMFYLCSRVTALDVSGFDTSKVETMTSMFYICDKLTALDVSRFNTANVTDMAWMFYGCSGLTSLDVSKFNTSRVTTMEGMFYNCSKLTSLDVSRFDTANTANLGWIFYGCDKLASIDVSHFNTSKATDLERMFDRCRSLVTVDVSGFDTSNVTNMQNMFYDCPSLTTVDLRNFDTSKVTTLRWMFWGCSSLTELDLSGFDTAMVTDTRAMFANCSKLTTVYVSDLWTTAAVTEGANMFLKCKVLVGGAGTTYDASHVDAAYAHIDGGTANPGYFTQKTAN